MKDVLKVNPQVLKWAREEAGYPVDEIADKLKIEPARYLLWESTGEEIPFSKLRAIATWYRRQIATFFLPEVPLKTKKPKDYRNLSLVSTPLSRETLLAFRRVRKYQHLLIEIYGQEYFENKYRWLKEYNLTLTDAPEFDQLAYWLREKLEFPFEDQVKEKSNDTAYKRWRESFENKLGVFSFQFSLPTDETQGFSYSDTVPFCIAINSNGYGANSRTFTLFHELAHLLQRQSGICVPDRVAKDQHIEYQINEFTGAVLIPKDRATRIIDPDKIYMTAKRFKVSSEVYVRRMHSLQLISQEEFFHLLEIIKKRVRPLKKGAFAGSPVQKCIAAKGQLFYDSVVTAAKNGLLSYSQASEALELKVNHFISV